MSARYTRFRPRTVEQRERVRVLAARVGAQLRRRRDELKLSQDAIATAAGFWQVGVSRLEAGRPAHLNIDVFFRLVDELALSIELVPRDVAVSRYHEEKEAAKARRSQRDLFADAKQELERAMKKEAGVWSELRRSQARKNRSRRTRV